MTSKFIIKLQYEDSVVTVFLHEENTPCTLLHTLHQTKINSKLITDWNLKHKPIKLQRENTGENLWDLELGNVLLYLMHKACFQKDRINKLNSSKLKTPALLKTVVNMERKAQDCEKVFAKHISHKGLVTRKIHMLHTCGCMSTCPYISDTCNPY